MGAEIIYGIISMAATLSDRENDNAEPENNDNVQKNFLIKPTNLSFITDSNHYQSDAQIVVGDERLDVHRYILNLISPTFHSKLTGNTPEAKTGIIEVNDCDFATVKHVIDYCYGHACPAKTSSESIAMLSFAKTYKILPIVEALEVSLQVELSLDNFYPIVQHAWDFEMTELKSKCAHFYKENYNKRIFTEEFVNMNPKVQVDLNREAANINE